MFWKNATVLQMWDWEVLTRFRKAAQKLNYSSQGNIGEILNKSNYNFQSRPRPCMHYIYSIRRDATENLGDA